MTGLLRSMSSGDRVASTSVYEVVYERLRAMAHQRMRSQPRGHLLEPTALVHEAFLRMVRCEESDWEDRNHFFAVAATAMRCILADHARARRSDKRVPEGERVQLDELILAISPGEVPFLELNDSLDRLAERNPEAAEIVQLRLFAGLTLDELVVHTRRPKRTVERLWAYGKARLKKDLLDV